MLADSDLPTEFVHGQEDIKDPVVTPATTPKNSTTHYKLFLLERKALRITCGGCIGTKQEDFCLKSKSICMVKSHKQKHSFATGSRVFIVSYTKTTPDGDNKISTHVLKRALFPSKYNFIVQDEDMDLVCSNITTVNASFASRGDTTNLELLQIMFDEFCDSTQGSIIRSVRDQAISDEAAGIDSGLTSEQIQDLSINLEVREMMSSMDMDSRGNKKPNIDDFSNDNKKAVLLNTSIDNEEKTLSGQRSSVHTEKTSHLRAFFATAQDIGGTNQDNSTAQDNQDGTIKKEPIDNDIYVGRPSKDDKTIHTNSCHPVSTASDNKDTPTVQNTVDLEKSKEIFNVGRPSKDDKTTLVNSIPAASTFSDPSNNLARHLSPSSNKQATVNERLYVEQSSSQDDFLSHTKSAIDDACRNKQVKVETVYDEYGEEFVPASPNTNPDLTGVDNFTSFGDTKTCVASKSMVDVGNQWNVDGLPPVNTAASVTVAFASAPSPLPDLASQGKPVSSTIKSHGDSPEINRIFGSRHPFRILYERADIDSDGDLNLNFQLPDTVEDFERKTRHDKTALQELYRVYAVLPLALHKERMRLQMMEQTCTDITGRMSDLEETLLDETTDFLRELSETAKTEWESLANDSISDIGDNVYRKVRKASLKFIKEQIDRLSAKLPSTDNPGCQVCPLDNGHGQCVCCNDLREIVKFLQAENNDLKEAHNILVRAHNSNMRKHDARIVELERKVNAGANNDAADAARITELTDQFDVLENSLALVRASAVPDSVVKDLGIDMAKVSYELVMMKARLGSSSVQLGGVTLPSLADAILFSHDNIPSRTFGPFVDLMALMDSPRDCFTDDKEYLDSLYNAHKTKMVSSAEVSTSASFLRVTPKCFGGKTDATVVHGSVGKLLSAVVSRDKWSSEGGQFGIKVQLSRELEEQVTRFRVEIDTSLEDDAKNLANAYLMESHRCYCDFVNWTESFFMELQAMSSVGEGEAWELILKCWLAFFVDLRKIRMQCSSLNIGGLDSTDQRRVDIVGKYVFTMGLAIQRQNEYREKGFRNHPTISTVINFYLFQHRVPSSLYEKQIKSIKNDISQLNVWKAQAVRDLKKAMA